MDIAKTGLVRACGTRLLVGASVVGALVLGGVACDKGTNKDAPETAANAVDTKPKPELVYPDKGFGFIRGYKDKRGSHRGVYGKVEGWKDAAKDFDRAAKQTGAPKRWISAKHLSWGWVALLRNEKDQGLRVMKQAVAAEDDWALAQLGLAYAYIAHKQWKLAMVHAKSAQKLAPKWWLPTATIGHIHRDTGKLKIAAKLYRRAIAKAPLEANIPSDLSLVYHALGRNRRARKWAKKAFSLDGRVVGANITYAERSLRREKARKALMHADVALSVGPNNGVAMLARGDALQALQRPKLARQAFTSAIELIDKHKQIGAPVERLAAIREALAKDKLPEARFKVKLEPKKKKKKKGNKS